MSILAAMFVILFNSNCTVFLEHRKIAKLKKQPFSSRTTAKKILNCWRRATALYNIGIVAILLANTSKSLNFYRFESAQNLVLVV